MTASTGEYLSKSHNTRSERVLAAIAERESVDPVDFDRPLYDVIDPDALDTLFQSKEVNGRVEFRYLGYKVTVYSDGEVELDLTDE